MYGCPIRVAMGFPYRYTHNIMHGIAYTTNTSKGKIRVWYGTLLLSTTSVCLCVSALEAINYINMILNLYNQLNKFVVFRNLSNEWKIHIVVPIFKSGDKTSVKN